MEREDELLPQDPKGTRLQTLIAHSGLSSRRAAERLIVEGKVSVNGILVTELGSRAMPEDIVLVEGKRIVSEEKKHYLLLNKPAGYLCALSDEYDRPLAADLFKPEISERIYNIGRLDLESCGLILFTNDGIFAKKAGHPSSGLVKEYEIETDYPVDPKFCERFEQGLDDDGEILKATRATIIGTMKLNIQLVEGKNREIRRALALFGLHARVLRRIAIGPLHLGALAEGSWRPLVQAEIDALDDLFRQATKLL